MSFSESIIKKINSCRDVKESSIKTYILNLTKILKLLEEDITIENLNSVLKDSKLVMSVLEDKKDSTIRNYLASIVVYLTCDKDSEDLISEYRKLMDIYQKKQNDNISNGKKLESQDKNWSTIKELKDILKNYKKQLEIQNVFKKDDLNKKEMDLLQKYVVGNLYIGDDANPPLRNVYAEMEIIKFNDYKKLSDNIKNKNNYLVIKNKSNKSFSLGDYKTKDKYGLKIIPVGKNLNKILNFWIKHNKSNYLLLNSQNEPMTKNGLSKYLVKVFEPSGKNISSSLLRSIYISEAFPPQNNKKQELADKMNHSVEVQGAVYAKED